MSSGGDTGGGAVALCRVLTNTAHELADLADTARAIDEATGKLLVEGGNPAPSAALLQEVDRMRQALDCLHILMANLARASGEAGDVPFATLAEGVYLEAIRRRCLQG